MCGFVIRNIHADGSDYKSDSFITPDCKSGVTMTSLLRAVFSCCHDKKNVILHCVRNILEESFAHIAK